MSINEGMVAALIADLDHHDKPTIRAAVDALIPLAEQSPELRVSLHQRLTRPGRENSWSLAYILGQFPSPSDAVVRTLVDALDHREPDIRWAVALLLIRIAKQDPHLINRLIDLSGAGTVNQKRMSLYCLRDLALSDVASLTALVNALNDNDPTVRVTAAICLKLRPDIPESVKMALLKIYVEDSDSRVRNAAAIVLANLGSPSEDFLIALRKESKSANRESQKTAEAALSILGKRRSASAENKSR
jgi:HEAT repeat protein